MSSKFDNIFKFEDQTQRIVADEEDIPKALKDFMDGKIFNTTKYFRTFVEEMSKVIDSGSINLPDGLTKLSTKFKPCEVCKSDDNVIPEYVRCRHEPDCEDHKKKLEDPNHQESCECSIFTSPCITWTKIGAEIEMSFSCILRLTKNQTIAGDLCQL